jgi:plastocyanin
MRKPILLAALAATTGLAATTAIPALAATKTIAVKDNLFSPKSVTVKKGTTVKWVWKGKAPHNVTVKTGPVKFHSPLKTSGSYSRKLTKRGTYRIVCTIHDGMSMKLKVS